MSDVLKKEILEFIDSFKWGHEKALEDVFLNGNCYWFAYRLRGRFGGVILYLPISGHFICRIGGTYFDVTGEVHPNEPEICFESYQMKDPDHYQRIYRNCVILK